MATMAPRSRLVLEGLSRSLQLHMSPSGFLLPPESFSNQQPACPVNHPRKKT